MFLPVTPRNLTGTLRKIPDGQRGIMLTVREMRRLVNESRINPAIRTAAINITQLQPERDCEGEVNALFRFVRDIVRYVGDVYDIETLTDPTRTLEIRAGDCDDKSTLLAALLESIGYPTRFVVAAYSDPRLYEHVFIEVQCNGIWFALDPTEGGGIGHEPPQPLARHVETGRE